MTDFKSYIKELKVKNYKKKGKSRNSSYSSDLAEITRVTVNI